MQKALVMQHTHWINFRIDILKSLGWSGDREKVEEEWRDFLVKMYHVSRMSTTCIANFLGMNVAIIRKDLRRLNIKTIKLSNRRDKYGMVYENLYDRCCEICKKPFSTIYWKEVTCSNPECKKKYQTANQKKAEKRRKAKYADFM